MLKMPIFGHKTDSMFKIVLLLTPVYVTLFWTIVLNMENRHNNDRARLFLGKFMLFAFILYFSHFLFFYPFAEIYLYIDPLYQYASLLVYPLFYIYVRLLTVDESFKLTKHFKYLALPSLFFSVYLIGILLSPQENYQTLITDYENSPWNFLKIVLTGMKLLFLIQVILCVTGNTILLKKYKYSAGQYYSDIEDSRIYKAELLNLCIILIGISSFVLGMLGRDFFFAEPVALAIASLVFSSLLFVIGLLGNVQKVVNPTYETDSTKEQTEALATDQEIEYFKAEVPKKILHLFVNDKIYLNSKLTIRDVAQIAGTNRTYVSNFINTRFNQNFCSFVNHYRLEELERTITEYPQYNNNTLAELCGFGSVDSMKRTVNTSYGIAYSEWRKGLLAKIGKPQDNLKAKA